MYQLYLILSGVITCAISYFCKMVGSFTDLWKPLLIFPAIFLAFILIHLLAFILFSLTADTKKEVSSIDNPYRRFMITSLRLYFRLVRTNIHVEGLEKIPDDKQYLLVSNHISIYDPMVTLVAFADKGLSFVSKKENLTVPFAGRYMIKSGCIGLDREDNRQAVKAINAAAQRIMSGVSAMGIYPEGWVNKTAKGLKEFRNGAFKIAKKAKVPIAVAVIENTREINRHLLSRSKDVYLKILDVIDYNEISALKTNEIGERVHSTMLDALTEDGCC